MAQKIVTLVTCDPCNAAGTESDAAERISITFNGRDYEADLCDKHFKDLSKKATTLVEGLVLVKQQARKVPTKSRPSGSGAREEVSERNRQIREWARSQGLDVPDRGRIPREVIEKYESSLSVAG